MLPRYWAILRSSGESSPPAALGGRAADRRRYQLGRRPTRLRVSGGGVSYSLTCLCGHLSFKYTARGTAAGEQDVERNMGFDFEDIHANHRVKKLVWL